MEWPVDMKKNEETILLVLFCAGILGGLLLPRWTFLNLNIRAVPLAPDSLRQYAAAGIEYGVILKRVAVSRGTLLFMLYFACYSAAGFWVLAGACLTVGMSMGFLGAMAVLQMRYFGVLFWLCALLPQWIFYGWTGLRLVRFMKKRRMRTLLCNGNPAPSYNKMVFLEFLAVLALAALGIFSEVYLNPGMLKLFLRIYAKI